MPSDTGALSGSLSLFGDASSSSWSSSWCVGALSELASSFGRVADDWASSILRRASHALSAANTSDVSSTSGAAVILIIFFPSFGDVRATAIPVSVKITQHLHSTAIVRL